MQHLYLHVPFCQRRCSYCDFSIAVRKRIPADQYVKAVLCELSTADPGPAARGGPISTIYFGGGTPSLLPPEAIAQLLRAADPGPAGRGDRGGTLEANPQDVALDASRARHHPRVSRL